MKTATVTDREVRAMALAFYEDLSTPVLLALLQWEDPNGVWDDRACDDEGYNRTPRHVAEMEVQRWICDDPTIDLRELLARMVRAEPEVLYRRRQLGEYQRHADHFRAHGILSSPYPKGAPHWNAR